MTDFSLITDKEVLFLTNSSNFEFLRSWGAVIINFIIIVVILKIGILFVSSRESKNYYLCSSIVFNLFYQISLGSMFIFFISFAHGVTAFFVNIIIIASSVIGFFVYKNLVSKRSTTFFNYQLEIMRLILTAFTIYFVISENIYSKILVILAVPYFGYLLLSESREKLNQYSGGNQV